MEFFTHLQQHPVAATLFCMLVVAGIAFSIRNWIERRRLTHLIYALPQLAETLPSLIKGHESSVVVTPCKDPNNWFAPHEKRLTLGSLRVTIRCSRSIRFAGIDPIRDPEHAHTWVIVEEFWVSAPTVIGDGYLYAKLRDGSVHHIEASIGDPIHQRSLRHDGKTLHRTYQEATIAIRDTLFTLS